MATRMSKLDLPFNWPLAGLILSQFPPSAVEAVADQEPGLPQLLSFTDCGLGLAWPWVAVNESDAALVLRHAVAGADRTMNITLRESFVGLLWSLKVMVAV